MYRVTIMVQNEDKSCKVIYLKEGDYIKEYKTLEEAELACFKKLIEIVKQRNNNDNTNNNKRTIKINSRCIRHVF
jgi:hypothetical protein